MSASTVSITANPAAAARRRPVVVGGEKKSSNVEMIPNESHLRGGVGDDKVTSLGTEKDVSHHSIRGEAVLERSSRDLTQVKKTSSTVSPRRSRKAATKPEKPRWLTVLSVLTKNFGLLLVLLALVQLIRKLILKSGDDLVGSPLGISKFEGRIAEVEALMKTTATMMQVQVDVVDRKIDQEVGLLKKEVSKQIEDRAVGLEGGLKNMETRTEGLEKSLGKLSALNLMTKEEFEKVYEELVKSSERGESDVSLDDLRAYAKDLVQKEIEKHAADGLGRVDYALGSSGATVVKHSEPFLAGKGGSWFSVNNPNGVHQNAMKVLQPSFGEPGQCFALKGSSGFIQIRLRTAIIPKSITLEHVAKSVAYDRSSAPKDSRISGWLQGANTEPDENRKMFLLTEFTYELDKSNAQTFDVLESAGSAIVDTIRFDFTSNHGSPSHTCIYRLRVHGGEPNPVSMMTMQSR